MGNAPPFIKSIQVNKVRHLQDILIFIDDSRPRHYLKNDFPDLFEQLMP